MFDEALDAKALISYSAKSTASTSRARLDEGPLIGAAEMNRVQPAEIICCIAGMLLQAGKANRKKIHAQKVRDGR
jgi:hypothetical protein